MYESSAGGGSHSNSSPPNDDMKYKIVYRMPRVKRGQKHLLGLTFGLVFVCIVMGFSRSDLGVPLQVGFISDVAGFDIWNIIVAFALLLLFISATILIEMAIAWITLVLFILSIFFPEQCQLRPGIAGLHNSLLFLGTCHFIGYLCGITLAFCYNLIVYIILRLHAEWFGVPNVAFVYNEKSNFNIIKSPFTGEEITLPTGNERKIYKFTIPVTPNYLPYTIVFIANPCHLDENGIPKRDPIVDDRDLFLSSVNSALYRFESDEVLGRPEIWSRVRVITLFNDQISSREENALAGGSRDVYEDYYFPRVNQPGISNNAGIPYNFDRVTTPIDVNIKKYLDDNCTQFRNKIQVVFVLTANKYFNRSSSLPCAGSLQPGSAEITYTDTDGAEGRIVNITHEIIPEYPGLASINVITARQKTYIHEFAHAMAHSSKGAIIDEYYDMDFASNLLTINQTQLVRNRINIPKRFGQYEGVEYHSDRDHPSYREFWQSFFPNREAKHLGCTMDRTVGQYQFDKLISAYMYDRLILKINRGVIY